MFSGATVSVVCCLVLSVVLTWKCGHDHALTFGNVAAFGYF